MSPEAQRIAIAEACGWKHRDCTNDDPIIRGGYKLPNLFCALAHGWWRDDDPENMGVYASPPNYLNDLNAMHEAEKVLFAKANTNEEAYRHQLTCLTGGWSTYHATAAQRAEAFLKTIGKWEEQPTPSGPEGSK